MRMPQDFVDAVNAAVHAIDPNAGTMTGGSISLGSDFDEWVGPQSMMKYGLGPMPPEDLAAFSAKFAEHRQALKDTVVNGAVESAKERMANRG